MPRRMVVRRIVVPAFRPATGTFVVPAFRPATGTCDEALRTPYGLRLDGGVRDLACARRSGAPRASRGISEDGRVFARPDRRIARGAAHARQPAAETRARWRHLRGAGRLRPAVLRFG